ncbi:unnamed protein product, partial [Callosobruchus maculatus]
SQYSPHVLAWEEKNYQGFQKPLTKISDKYTDTTDTEVLSDETSNGIDYSKEYSLK